MSRTLRAWARLVGAAAILGVLAWRMGTGPFLEGLRRVDGPALAVAAGIGVLITLCCAWRWTLVARGLGVGIGYRAAVASCYRSQFLNVTLPGGVLGDVHRGLRHGRAVGDTGRALRSVVWERFAGQVIQVVIAVVVLLLLPSPVRAILPGGVAAVVVAGVVVGVVAVVMALLLARGVRRSESSLAARTARATARDLRDGLLARRAWPGIVLASAVAVAGHVLTFVVAARTAGLTASPERVLPLALLVLLAMGVPANIAGWGPREGVAAWAFAAAGLGAAAGVTTAVVYGVMVFVASLPGAVVLVAAWLHRGHRDQQDHRRHRDHRDLGRPGVAVAPPKSPALPPRTGVAVLEGAPRG